MKITKITVTGADDSVSLKQLLLVAEKFPMVEFGILLSRSQTGNPRFPSAKWLAELNGEGLNLSGHICGAWVREILMGKWPSEEFKAFLGSRFFERFARWQLNTHGQRHKWQPDFIHFIANTNGPRGIIFQFDEKNNALIEAAIESGNPNIAALFDMSHGAGALPSEWPSLLPGIACGYAGGLSPENVVDQLRLIDTVAGDAEIWIDAETLLRSPDGYFFDLRKVEDFISAAISYKRDA